MGDPINGSNICDIRKRGVHGSNRDEWGGSRGRGLGMEYLVIDAVGGFLCVEVVWG